MPPEASQELLMLFVPTYSLSCENAPKMMSSNKNFLYLYNLPEIFGQCKKSRFFQSAQKCLCINDNFLLPLYSARNYLAE
jgi:hypothetical protein